MSLPFFQGVSCVRKGIRDFYGNRKLWKYALFPLLLTFAIYILLMAALIAFTWYLFGQLKDWVSFLPEWLNGLSYGIGAILFLGAAGVFLLIIFSTVSTFYEMCGGLFFDYLTASYDHEKFSCSPPEQSFRQSVNFLFHIFIYSLNTSILSIILLI